MLTDSGLTDNEKKVGTADSIKVGQTDKGRRKRKWYKLQTGI